jgi:hypothetical protein
MIFHFRRLDANDGFLVSLEDWAGLEICVLLDDGFRDLNFHPWEESVAYTREI